MLVPLVRHVRNSIRRKRKAYASERKRKKKRKESHSETIQPTTLPRSASTVMKTPSPRIPLPPSYHASTFSQQAVGPTQSKPAGSPYAWQRTMKRNQQIYQKSSTPLTMPRSATQTSTSSLLRPKLSSRQATNTTFQEYCGSTSSLSSSLSAANLLSDQETLERKIAGRAERVDSSGSTESGAGESRVAGPAATRTPFRDRTTSLTTSVTRSTGLRGQGLGDSHRAATTLLLDQSAAGAVHGRAHSSLYSSRNTVDDGFDHDSGVYDKLRAKCVSPSTPASFMSRQSTTLNTDLEEYDLTLGDCDDELGMDYSDDRIASARQAFVDDLYSTERETEYPSCRKQLTFEEVAKEARDGTLLREDKSQIFEVAIEEIEAVEPKVVVEKDDVYNEMFYKELNRLRTEFTSVRSVMSIVNERLDNILCDVRLQGETQDKCYRKMDYLEHDIGRVRYDCDKIEWLDNRLALQESRLNTTATTTRNGRKMPSSATSYIDKYLDDHYFNMNPHPYHSGRSTVTSKQTKKATKLAAPNLSPALRYAKRRAATLSNIHTKQTARTAIAAASPAMALSANLNNSNNAPLLVEPPKEAEKRSVIGSAGKEQSFGPGQGHTNFKGEVAGLRLENNRHFEGMRIKNTSGSQGRHNAFSVQADGFYVGEESYLESSYSEHDIHQSENMIIAALQSCEKKPSFKSKFLRRLKSGSSGKTTVLGHGNGLPILREGLE